MAQPVNSTTFSNNSISGDIGNGGKKKELSIGSNRASGGMLLRFNAPKAGEVSITILNESGKIVSQQSNHVTKSINTILLKNATGLSEGSYQVQLFSNNETYTTSFFIFK